MHYISYINQKQSANDANKIIKYATCIHVSVSDKVSQNTDLKVQFHLTHIVIKPFKYQENSASVSLPVIKQLTGCFFFFFYPAQHQHEHLNIRMEKKYLQVNSN